MKMISVALFALAAYAAPAQAATNLIVNGGFDLDSSVASGGYTNYKAGDTIGGGGWTVLGDPSSAGLNISTSYSEAGLTFNSQGGANAYDLTGIGNTSPADGIVQSIATAIGQAYTLSFYLGNADGTNNANYTLPSSLSLSIDGGPAQTFTNSSITSGGINWKLFSTTFTASSALTSIQFNNATPQGDSYAGLDSVSLIASGAPEPAAWGMMLLGFGLVGSTLRSRRKRLVLA